jgi:PAS domain-containing protein
LESEEVIGALKKDQRKTKQQLIEELEVLRRRIASLEEIGAVTRQGPSGNSLVEQASDGIFVADAQGNMVDVNSGSDRICTTAWANV